LPLARPVKIAVVGLTLVALAVTSVQMVLIANRRHHLTEDPLSLNDPAEIRTACEILIDRSFSRGGSHVKSRFQLQVTLVNLRDTAACGEDRATRDALLGDLYEEIAERLTAPDAANREEMLALLSETRPTADNPALWDLYQQALAKHGIAAVAN
jgi:hypothetical protein